MSLSSYIVNLSPYIGITITLGNDIITVYDDFHINKGDS
tara:strand:+ start:1972 stop:2088 length:117 start_codon:yes stop_codon:yes gene_type:complete